MKELQILINSTVESNQLLLSWHPEIEDHLLFLSNPINRRIVHSINFNGGELILGLDNNSELNSLELNRSKRHWRILDDKPNTPNPIRVGSIEFININSPLNELELSLIVQTDKSHSFAKIEIGISNNNSSSFWVAISDQCFAEITDNCLKGFWIELTR